MSPCFLGRPNTIRISSEGNGCYSTLCDGGWSGFISPRDRAVSLNKNLDKALQPRTLWPDYSALDKKNKKGSSLFLWLGNGHVPSCCTDVLFLHLCNQISVVPSGDVIDPGATE